MPYASVDKLQKALVENVFHYAKDSKKAAGRALGTLVEIITYYLLKSWGMNNQISIERGLEEYGNPDITHNVEFSLHPIVSHSILTIPKSNRSVTAKTVLKALANNDSSIGRFKAQTNNLLSNGVLRNACTIGISKDSFLLCSVAADNGNSYDLHVYEQSKKPYSVFECKRVGVEEGMKKGPQTIEKAKQGAYVARSASSLQKIRTDSGHLNGIIYRSDGTHVIKPFVELLEEIVFSNDREMLRRFILTIGVVSNHGNWFTAENQNKELKVLAQSYDWLLFLTDKGLAEFIESFILNPTKTFEPVRNAFMSSYTATKTKNQFTKVQMNIDADRLLLEFFSVNLKTIEGWFNVISPVKKKLPTLKKELAELKNKNWQSILK